MRILVAEDHATLARSIADGLRDEGYAVDLTFDGAEAHRWAAREPYDCLVLDIMLPNRDGVGIVESLRRAGSAVPVLLLTAKDAVEDRVKGLDAGADDYLVKPFAWEELLARVRALVRRQSKHKSSLLTVADLTVDTAAKTASRAGKPIPLSAKEYALLEFLAHRAGQTVSRAEIWNHLYDRYDENNSNVVDVYVGYLRKKIDRDFEPKLLHPRLGLGYVLTPTPNAC